MGNYCPFQPWDQKSWGTGKVTFSMSKALWGRGETAKPRPALRKEQHQAHPGLSRTVTTLALSLQSRAPGFCLACKFSGKTSLPVFSKSPWAGVLQYSSHRTPGAQISPSLESPPASLFSFQPSPGPRPPLPLLAPWGMVFKKVFFAFESFCQGAQVPLPVPSVLKTDFRKIHLLPIYPQSRDH